MMSTDCMPCYKNSETTTMRFVASSWLIFYNEPLQVLMQRWVGQFRDIFDQDNYHPISVSSSLEWRDVTASFPYESPFLEASPFPKHFPFSAMVPRFDKSE